MNRILTSAILCLMLVFSSGVSAQDFQKGFDAYKSGDYASALREWKPLAEQGHAKAQSNLGWMYANGEGVPQDDAEAVRWYRLAAEQGNASAQFNLGLMYDKGEGVPQDDAEAVRWYRLAAEQGFALAQSNLGVMYDEGEGVPTDIVYAHMWWNLAAANGQENAAKNRDIAAGRMSAADISAAQKLARECFAKNYKGC